MKYVITVFFSALIASSHVQANENDIISKIGALNEASIEWLGVSLGAVAYLSQITPNSYMPLDYLEHSGTMELISELANAGYITKHERKGLPDGHQPEEMFVTLRPTELGINVIANIKVQSKALTSKGSRMR